MQQDPGKHGPGKLASREAVSRRSENYNTKGSDSSSPVRVPGEYGPRRPVASAWRTALRPIRAATDATIQAMRRSRNAATVQDVMSRKPTELMSKNWSDWIPVPNTTLVHSGNPPNHSSTWCRSSATGRSHAARGGYLPGSDAVEFIKLSSAL